VHDEHGLPHGGPYNSGRLICAGRAHEIASVVDGNWSRDWELRAGNWVGAKGELQDGKWYPVSIKVRGKAVKCFFNNNLMFDDVHPSLSRRSQTPWRSSVRVSTATSKRHSGARWRNSKGATERRSGRNSSTGSTRGIRTDSRTPPRPSRRRRAKRRASFGSTLGNPACVASDGSPVGPTFSPGWSGGDGTRSLDRPPWRSVIW
jgi:hypothetical protein